MNNLQNIISQVTVGPPSEFGGLCVYPLLANWSQTEPLMELDQAIQQGSLKITEISESGSVPNLKVTNTSDSHVLILDGEELIGAKQNRIVNVTIIVAAHSTITIPVTCVEAGRWRWRGAHFRSGKSVAHPSLRRDKFQQVTDSLKFRESFSTDQGKVWESIGAKAMRMGTSSPTSALADIEEDFHVDDDVLMKNFPRQDGQVGYLAFIRGGFAGGDVLGSGDLLGRKYLKFLRSCYLDSRDTHVTFPTLSQAEILERVTAAELKSVPSPGEGTDFRFETNRIIGGSTLLGDQLVHLTVFAKQATN